ncbi:MAG: 30S ribosomal protein S12 methylthiotransferase RimO [Desulfobulbaceae bacterium]|nr:30S ribosomal protein S12 methylthiotransferase RimO [Desulfobulbaceae bacterium]MCK5437108.1 30S ribosomal protein S12 methylthiotransferase RimO [Desulfobulbaceae bacterium]
MNKKIFIQSLGCPKNLVDSEVMLGLLKQAGYRVSDTPEEANILLVNTCGFIQPAVEESIDEILEFARLKRKEPDKKLVVTGCLVQRYREGLKEQLPEVNLFVGTDEFHNIVAHLKQCESGESRMLKISGQRFLLNSSFPRLLSTPSHRAYMKITEGCSNRCAYCLIPAIRGPMRSRRPSDLILEAKRLADNGVKELTLIAQDLTAYGRDMNVGVNLESLLGELLSNCAIPWIRLLYLHPARLDVSLLELMASSDRLMPYLDVPLQHVSSRILKTMNRGYDRGYAEMLIRNIRKILPGAAIRTTFLVGFPGETKDDAAQIEEFIRTYKLEHVGIFTYSNEEGCPAVNFSDQCTEDEKNERRNRLMEIQAEISLENNRRMVGKVEQVLVEGVSRETDLLLEGRTRYQAPDIDGCVYISAGHCNAGDIVEVCITEAHPYDLVGEIL